MTTLPRVGALVEGPGLLPVALRARQPGPHRRHGPRTASRPPGRPGSPRPWPGSGSTAAAKKKYKAYSLGMRQRLGLASALLRPAPAAGPRRTHQRDGPARDPGDTPPRPPAGGGGDDGVPFLAPAVRDRAGLFSHVGVMHRGKLLMQGMLDDLRASAVPQAPGRGGRPRPERRRCSPGLGMADVDREGSTSGGRRSTACSPKTAAARW